MDKVSIGKFIKFFINISGSSSLGFVVFRCSFFISMGLLHFSKFILTNDPNWIGAFGAILTVCALIECFSNSIYPEFQEDIKPKAVKSAGMWHIIPDRSGELSVEVSEDEAKAINSSQYLYICNKYKDMARLQCLSILGTVVWAYAFLIQQQT